MQIEEFDFKTKLTQSGCSSYTEWLVKLALEKGIHIAGAESCTGGMVAEQLTRLSGVSACFEGAVVSYSNRIKNAILGVPMAVLDQWGAVSTQTVEGMLNGVQRQYHTECGYAISGIAGPGGGTPSKPVGTVVVGAYFNSQLGFDTDLDATTEWKKGEGRWVQSCFFSGNREDVRQKSAEMAVKALIFLILTHSTLDNSNK